MFHAMLRIIPKRRRQLCCEFTSELFITHICLHVIGNESRLQLDRLSLPLTGWWRPPRQTSHDSLCGHTMCPRRLWGRWMIWRHSPPSTASQIINLISAESFFSTRHPDWLFVSTPMSGCPKFWLREHLLCFGNVDGLPSFNFRVSV